MRPYLGGTAEVIVVDLFYGLEVDHALQLGLVFVWEEKQTFSFFRRLGNTSPRFLFFFFFLLARHLGRRR